MPDTRVRPTHRVEPSFETDRDLRLSSPSLLDGDSIPSRHSADGGNSSPALSWSLLPEGTASVAVTCEDPIGPEGEPFTLWVLFNVPANLRGIPEGVSKVSLPPEVPGAQQGINDTGRTGYDGPAPPPGHHHRYLFTVTALGCVLALPPGANRLMLDRAMQGHVLAQGRVVGTFGR